ncbi:MAG: KpsF/GutQ family sugar-phosphate isomerase [Deltaproteobacteria bacterium]|nr:KpsF/GutQ family sugar-phosphate isomerase [Deltaproteobacteria bacterium]
MTSLDEAKRVLEVEAQCIMAARDKLDARFDQAVDLIVEAVKRGGRTIVTGVGKSGKIAAKVAATLSSMGTPALFLHASEASHGDLGIVSSNDVLLILSYSGSSEEVLRLLPSLRSRGTKIVSIVGNMKSALAMESNLALDGSVAQEACPLNLAPTSSTTVALALGDALSVALSRRFDYKEEQFASNHPGGALGRRLTLTVADLMKKGDELPWVASGASMDQVINIATEKKLGAVLVRDESGKWTGLITDGDIRRALKHKTKFFDFIASDIMTHKPVSVTPGEKAIRALELMENRSSQISVLPVTDPMGSCVGLVRLHDLIGRLSGLRTIERKMQRRFFIAEVVMPHYHF